jgi:hypothetical protein
MKRMRAKTMALLDHFTRTELLAGAEAAEPYPPGHKTGWGISAAGDELHWNNLDEAIHL